MATLKFPDADTTAAALPLTTDLVRQLHTFQHASLTDQLLNAIPTLLCVLNPQRQIVYTNQLLLDLLDIDDPAQVYGLHVCAILDCQHSASAHDHHDADDGHPCQGCNVLRGIAASRQQTLPVSRDCFVTQRSGHVLELRVWAQTLYLHGDQYTLFSVADLSRERQRDLLERVFLHDIRNTAALIVSYTDLLDMLEEDERHQFRADLVRISERLLREIDTHQILSSAEKGQLKLLPTRINPADLLHHCQTEYSTYAREWGIRVHVDVAPGTPEIYTDQALLERVIGNMLKNALEACTRGDTVTLMVDHDDDQIVFAVHNPGFILPEIQARIFRRSTSTKGNKRGLGTYSIKLLSEKYLQGAAWFESTRADGTTFYVSHPLGLTAVRL
ncbi:MAG: HAMP domain-containing histidine kinase [Chloroflexi bacterium]|nr:HAMP domain-containing histidine kinase [Chloroflexota bacterium]